MANTASRRALTASAPVHRQHGFTLIELVLVVIILGVLAAVALPRFIDLRHDAEHAAIDAWVGALRTAQTTALAAALVDNAGYSTPQSMSLFNIVRCDASATLGTGGGQRWQGHHLALAGLRNGVFQDPSQTACNGNTISFTTKSQRVISIVNGSDGVTWSAAPAY